MLQLPESWVWDSWYVFDGTLHHAFYLRASRALKDPNRRHRHPYIGHATSTDLVNWTVQSDAIAISDPPAFDSWTTWTGSVVKGDDGMWWMYYTGTSKEDGGDIQKIGAAKSKDLYSWEKISSKALVEADPKFYEMLDYNKWHDQAFRDPWVFKQDGLWHMLITARSIEGERFSRGVVGHATSQDMLTWSVQPPLTAPNGGFGQMEVFQVENVHGQAVLLWCCGPNELTPELREKYPYGGMFSVVGDSLLGPFDITKSVWFPHTSIYAARIVEHKGKWYMLGFENETESGFGGRILDPIEVQIQGHGLVPASS